MSTVKSAGVSVVGPCSCGEPTCEGPFPAPNGSILHTSNGVVSEAVEPEPNIISEIDGWRMTPAGERNKVIPWMYNTCTILSHYCEKNGWRQYLSPDDMMNAKACPTCHEDIPESVLTVWHLYNADEISKYAEQIRGWVVQDKGKFTEEVHIYGNSKPLLDLNLFKDPDENLYKANGKLYDKEEMSEWNGAESNVLLFSHDNSVLAFGEDGKLEATSCA